MSVIEEEDAPPSTKRPSTIGQEWAERIADAALDASGHWPGSLDEARRLAGCDVDAPVVLLAARHRWTELVEECRAEAEKNAELEAVLEKHARAEAARLKGGAK